MLPWRITVGAMGKRRTRLVLVGRQATDLADWLAPALLLVSSLWEIWRGTLFSPGIAGPRGLETAAALLYCAGLTVRRRAPLLALALVLVGNAAQVPYVGPSQQTGLEGFLAMLLAVYSVGAHAPRRTGMAAVAATIALIFVGEALTATASPAQDAGLYVLLAALWLFGDALRRHRLRTAQLEDRASELDRRRGEEAQAAAADERARIARELHDVVAHSLSVMVVQTGAARQMLTAEPDVARRQLLSAENTGRQALAEMRRLLGIVRSEETPMALAPQPSLGHVDLLVEQVRDAGLDVRLHLEGERRTLTPGVDLAAYRIVQEALTNTVKHAGPARAQVLVRYGRDEVEIEVRDDGRGARVNGSAGHGLVGMRERVALYGGALSAGPGASGGFRVHAILPLEGCGT
jgi:signal transduction histidine kinase